MWYFLLKIFDMKYMPASQSHNLSCVYIYIYTHKHDFQMLLIDIPIGCIYFILSGVPLLLCLEILMLLIDMFDLIILPPKFI